MADSKIGGSRLDLHAQGAHHQHHLAFVSRGARSDPAQNRQTPPIHICHSPEHNRNTRLIPNLGWGGVGGCVDVHGKLLPRFPCGVLAWQGLGFRGLGV